MSKEELEVLLKAFKLMEDSNDENFEERKSIATIKAYVKEIYMQLIMEELTKK